ncbi:MAG: DUF3641 domain-containing protein [Candidatus Omnitrophica bacterium]|nr:DUF3641 domain-containing protein [Candidatus Omnitrophota bacterium]
MLNGLGYGKKPVPGTAGPPARLPARQAGEAGTGFSNLSRNVPGTVDDFEQKGKHGGPPLQLNLVYNPVGPHLPPNQEDLEKDYKERLREDWGIEFNKLYAITNMPITRYAKYLKAFNQYETYTQLLINSFNPATLDGLMCRNTLSVSWDGRLYDCDFNQALGMPIRQAQGNGERSRTMQMRNGKPMTIFDLLFTGTRYGRDRFCNLLFMNLSRNVPGTGLEGRRIETGNHCFGCTAGAGSSCQGTLK